MRKKVTPRTVFREYIWKFLEKSPYRVFIIYYRFVLRQLKIKKLGDKWMIQNVAKDGLTLISPSPKLVVGRLKYFESKFERFFKIEPGDTVLDVGACIGDTTIPMAIKTGSDGFIIAVEPHPVNIQCLKLNLKNFHNVEIVEKAVWNSSGVVRFNIHKTPTGHSILEDKERDRYMEVPCDTLDNIVGDRVVDFAKIDVQGAEVMILKEGASKFLKNTRKLIVETHYRFDSKKRTYPEIIRILNVEGYETRLTDDGVVHSLKKLVEA